MGHVCSVPVDFSLRLKDFQQILLSVWANPKSLLTKNHSNVLYFQLLVVAFIHVYTYGNGVLFDWSGVDRLWSVTPMIYANSFWIHKYLNYGVLDTRLLLMSSLVTVWGVRLTYNFAIKGGYAFKHEDYRWEYVRKNMLPQNVIVRELFHILFVNIYQHLLIWSFTFPLYLFYQDRSPNAPAFDVKADGLFALLWSYFFALEVIADRQMFRYQTAKYRWYAFKKDKKNKSVLQNQSKLYALFPMHDIERYEIGFFHDGVYAYSRHPNYYGEQGMWLTFYLWAAYYYGHNWTMIGSVLLVLLFQGSLPLAEKMSREKYPLYRVYQQKVSALIPWFPSKDLKDALSKKVNIFY